MKDPAKGSISVLNLMEVVTENGDPTEDSSYFRTLCQQSFPGPLVGGSFGNKELNKWIDERIGNCGSPDMDFRKGEVLRLLLSLLKIACQYYGKFRSPFGTDAIVSVVNFMPLMHAIFIFSLKCIGTVIYLLYITLKDMQIT